MKKVQIVFSSYAYGKNFLKNSPKFDLEIFSVPDPKNIGSVIVETTHSIEVLDRLIVGVYKFYNL